MEALPMSLSAEGVAEGDHNDQKCQNEYEYACQPQAELTDNQPQRNDNCQKREPFIVGVATRGSQIPPYEETIAHSKQAQNDHTPGIGGSVARQWQDEHAAGCFLILEGVGGVGTDACKNEAVEVNVFRTDLPRQAFALAGGKLSFFDG